VPLVNIAQVFAYSGMRELAFKTSGIKTPADLKGRKVAVWFGGNEFALLATLAKYKLDPQKDLTLVQQPFDMNLLLQKQVDAAAAMTYNEYKQVLDAGVKPDDLVVIDFNKATARVYLGSYNFSSPADIKNGENLLLIRDRRIAVSYVVEAVRIFDHYEFRVTQLDAAKAKKELALKKPPRNAGEEAWWSEDYTIARKIRDRKLFA
jgi:hypothetical protein